MSSRSARTPQPADRLDLRELTGAREDGGRLQLQRAVDGRFTWRIDVHARRGASRLVLLLPSDEPPAPGTSELDADLFDDAHVAVLVGSIPASPEGDPVHELGDVLAHLTALVRDMCVLMGVDQSDVLVYGAGMAGCWALMLAIELDGACAVGDSPWLEISGDDVPGVPGATAERVLGDPAEASSGGQPVRLSVVDRMLEAKRIPPFLVLTDPDDLNFRGHVDLIGRPTELRDACLHVGTTRLEVRAAPAARAATPGDVARVVNCVLGQGWVTERRPDPTYRELVERATQSIRAVRFVRDAEDHARFARAREDLDLITKVNPSSDWPYLRLCSLLKSWTNTFSEDMLVAAQQAFARRQSLEAFIYCCRGIFANREVHQARAELEELIRRTEDPQVASVGEIFLALVAYELGDFQQYARRIDVFRADRAEGFDPYIAIPVSTVYTGTSAELVQRSRDRVTFLDADLAVPAGLDAASFVAVASCDVAYFERYAEYLVRSFSLTNADDGALVLAVIGADQHALDARMAQWQSRGVTAVAVGVECGANIGPSASLLRFSLVAPLLETYDVPIVVLDLDAVVEQSLRGLLESIGHVDVASRILGYGVAPWEKYTGGFAVFRPTTSGRKVADYVARAAATLVRPGAPQWWIDQNCFEAGIRLASEEGELVVHNVMSVRDRYCTMPVGPAAAKEHALRNAMDRIVSGASHG